MGVCVMGEYGYNGWKNYETWAVNLWLMNDEGTVGAVNELALEVLTEGPPDYVDSSRAPQWERGRLGEVIAGMVEEFRPDLGASLWADLLGAALSEVDWYDIADGWLDGFDYGLVEGSAG